MQRIVSGVPKAWRGISERLLRHFGYNPLHLCQHNALGLTGVLFRHSPASHVFGRSLLFATSGPGLAPVFEWSKQSIRIGRILSNFTDPRSRDRVK